MTDKTHDWLEEGDGFADISLTSPLKIDGTDVSVVRMREPTVGDQRANDKMKGTDADKEVALLANLTEIAPADLDRLSLKNYKRLQVALMGFID